MLPGVEYQAGGCYRRCRSCRRWASATWEICHQAPAVATAVIGIHQYDTAPDHSWAAVHPAPPRLGGHENQARIVTAMAVTAHHWALRESAATIRATTNTPPAAAVTQEVTTMLIWPGVVRS